MVTCVMYSYFIICDTDNSSDFHIEMTTMKDYRLRFSALKSNHNRRYGNNSPVEIHVKTNSSVCEQCELPSFHRLLKKNYYYYLLEKKDFISAEDATSYKNELIRCRSEYIRKLNLPVRQHFTVSF